MDKFNLIVLIIIANLFNIIEALPVKHKVDPVKALENPDLFGGDILGVKLRVNESVPILKNAKPYDFDSWPMGIIPFVIDSELESIRDLIYEAMDQYHQLTCIRFKKRTNERDYINIFKGYGCYSYIGRNGGAQEVSLSEGCWYLGTIVHELMHAVGFYHEQNRSDRDQYLIIHYDHIQGGLEAQFKNLSQNENRLLVPFDFNSIMLYGSYSFTKDGQMTMEPNPEEPSARGVVMREVNEKYGLSSIDVEAIQQLYKCG